MAILQIKDSNGNWQEIAALKGDTGPKGEDGVTPNITVKVTTLDAGSDATVTKTGASDSPTFTIGIPKGDKGDTPTGVVKSVNNKTPDVNGNVTIQTGGDTSNLVPKTGNRGVLAGYETLSVSENVVVNANSPDFQSFGTVADSFGSVVVEAGEANTCWVKCVAVNFLSDALGGTGVTVTLGDFWDWADMKAPTITGFGFGLLILVWQGDTGIARYVSSYSEG